jgi:hypothetical protein
MASVLTPAQTTKKNPPAGAGGLVVRKTRLPAGDGMAAVVRHARAVVTTVTAAIVGTAVTIGRATAVIDRSAAVVAVTVVIVAAVLGCGDRKPGADDTGKRRRRGSATATTIISAPRADIGRVAGPGRSRYAFARGAAPAKAIVGSTAVSATAAIVANAEARPIDENAPVRANISVVLSWKPDPTGLSIANHQRDLRFRNPNAS